MFSNLGSKWRKKRLIVISILLSLSILGGYFSIDHVTLFTHLPGAIWTQNTMLCAIFLLVLGLFAEKSSLESLDSSLGLDS